MLTLRARLFAIISIVVLLVLAVVIGLLWYGKRSQAPAGGEVPTTGVAPAAGGQNVTGGAVPGAITGVPVQPITTEAMEKNAVKQLAKIFIERYGSFSTDSGYQNIVELEGLLTAKLWASLSAKIGTPVAGGFVGVTTRAVAATLTDWKKDQSAVVNIQVAQTEERNGVAGVFHKNVDVKFLKVKGQWLVDAFVWGK